MIDIKRAVMDNRRVTFSHYFDGNLWYTTEFGEEFPVQISDLGNAKTFATEKASLFMRYMRKYNKVLEEASASSE